MMTFENPFQTVLEIAREAEEKGIDLDALLPILYRRFLVSPPAIKEALAKQNPQAFERTKGRKNRVATNLYGLTIKSLELNQQSCERPGLLWTEETLNDLTVRAVLALQSAGVTREQVIETWKSAREVIDLSE